MFLRSLTPEERREVYDGHILRDIPPTEPKSFACLERLHSEGICRMLGAFEDGELAGYAYIQHPPALSIELLDFFAVPGGRRGRGLGRRFLTLLTEKERFGPTLVAEVEDPEAAGGEAAVLCARRAAFYERCGWHDTGLRTRVGDYRCRLYSPAPALNEGLLRRELRALYDAVFGEWAREHTDIF